MNTIAVKTTFVFPNKTFEKHYYKVVTLFTKKTTVVFKNSLLSGFDEQLMLVAEKHESYEECFDGHDRWVSLAEEEKITFKNVTEMP